MFKGSKTELNEVTNRTAGTADTIQKTCDSSKNGMQSGKPPMNRPQSGVNSLTKINFDKP